MAGLLGGKGPVQADAARSGVRFDRLFRNSAHLEMGLLVQRPIN